MATDDFEPLKRQDMIEFLGGVPAEDLQKYIDDLRHNSERRVSADFDTETADQIADELETLIASGGEH